MEDHPGPSTTLKGSSVRKSKIRDQDDDLLSVLDLAVGFIMFRGSLDAKVIDQLVCPRSSQGLSDIGHELRA